MAQAVLNYRKPDSEDRDRGRARWFSARSGQLLFALIAGVAWTQLVGWNFTSPGDTLRISTLTVLWLPEAALIFAATCAARRWGDAWRAGAVSIVLSWVGVLALAGPLVVNTGARFAALLGGWVPLAVVIYGLMLGADWAFERIMENNYKTILIGRYLRRRRIAWVSLIAVTLCTTMVLVVISVMGGWLDMFENSARGLTGDIVISARGLSGFPYYQEIIDGMKADPNTQVVAAVPTIQTYGLLNIWNERTVTVQVWGIPLEDIGKVNVFPESLYRQYTQPKEQGKTPKAPTFDLHDLTKVQFDPLPDEIVRQGRNLGPTGDPTWAKLSYDGFELAFRGKMTDAERDTLAAASSNRKWRGALKLLQEESNWPGLIAGGPLLDIRKGKSGDIEGRDEWKYSIWAKLTMLAIPNDQQIKIENKTEMQCWIVDDSHTGMWQYDNDHVYVPFDVLQRTIGMGEEKAAEMTALADIRGDPGPMSNAKAPLDGTYHLQRFANGDFTPVDTAELKQGQPVGFRSEQGKVIAFAGDKTFDLGAGPAEAVWQYERPIVVPARVSDIHVRLKEGTNPLAALAVIDKLVKGVMDKHHIVREPPTCKTWKQANELFIGAIEHEKLLVVFLFGIISIVAIFLIFCIFYMIVAEKIKDIGIIKSVGATNTGVAGIFLGYGLTIGIAGGAMGLLASYLIVHYINQIHDWLGQHLGLIIWNPEVYAFDKIPNTMQPMSTVIIVSVAIVASVLGALIPAIRAAQLHPVEALRWE